jgi:hypothetical protein
MTVERIAIGNDIYLWKLRNDDTGELRKTAKALISSHGGIAIMNGGKTMQWNSSYKLPPTMHFFSPHGRALLDPTLAKVYSGEAQVQETLPLNRTPDYVLSKFQSKNGRETYQSVADILTDSKAGSWSEGAAMKLVVDAIPYFPNLDPNLKPQFERQLGNIAEGRLDMDIVTIRNRISNKMTGVRLSKVVNDLADAGHVYLEFYCAFCRGGGAGFNSTA